MGPYDDAGRDSEEQANLTRGFLSCGDASRNTALPQSFEGEHGKPSVQLGPLTHYALQSRRGQGRSCCTDNQSTNVDTTWSWGS